MLGISSLLSGEGAADVVCVHQGLLALGRKGEGLVRKCVAPFL